jgi:hypothetical protein
MNFFRYISNSISLSSGLRNQSTTLLPLLNKIKSWRCCKNLRKNSPKGMMADRKISRFALFSKKGKATSQKD